MTKMKKQYISFKLAAILAGAMLTGVAHAGTPDGTKGTAEAAGSFVVNKTCSLAVSTVREEGLTLGAIKKGTSFGAVVVTPECDGRTYVKYGDYYNKFGFATNGAMKAGLQFTNGSPSFSPAVDAMGNNIALSDQTNNQGKTMKVSVRATDQGYGLPKIAGEWKYKVVAGYWID
ncbi:hypothetical protein MLQ35_023905 [Escherichia coli]|nr:hypothetical protein [Escherichia coli]EFH7546718.1 hypothetical protein [Escherichia coli]EFJ3314635.1 hypothetical protein [Escherichia coli]EFN9654888.1 hypothetical protein [Escherichia coli]EIE2933742.1 hypothetical protein [Escherichia coli]